MKNQRPKKTTPTKLKPAVVDQKLMASAVVYDKTTGRIVASHFLESIADQPICELNLEQILEDAAEDDFTMGLVEGREKDNLAVMEVPIDFEPLQRMLVDIGSGKLVSRPCLQLTTAKNELEGDGKDSTKIEVSVVDTKGKQLRGFDSEIEIRTSRGKLSARGGRINLSKGTASIKLTSVAETVSRVRVSARSLGIPCERAFVELSFM